MVRSKKKSSNKSLKNMHPPQFNNPRRNVNNFGGCTADMNMQNHNLMPNDMTQNKNTGNTSKQDHNMIPNVIPQSLANLNGQNFSMMTKNTANMIKQDRNIIPNPQTKSSANLNGQSPNMLPNAVTHLPQWHSQITLNDILNSYISGPNSGDSLFTSGREWCPLPNFQTTFDCNQININNGIDQSNLPLANGKDLTDNGPRDNVASRTVPVGRPYGKHSLFKKYDHYFSFKVMKTSNSDTSEFKMRNKDFPALPGTQKQKYDAANTSSTRENSNQQWSNTNIRSKLLNKLNMDQLIDHNSSGSYLDTDFHLNGSTVPKPGVQTSLTDGKVTNIPSSMLRDQFGIIGQLVTMRTAEYCPKLVTLTFGQDLTSLGMNLNSPENIYPTFAGPFQNSPLEPHNIEYDVPSEYKIHDKIKDKLAPIKLSEYMDDLLFYLFFTHVGDGIQMAAARELRTRGWRYHIGQRIWITPVSGSSNSKINYKCGRGTFYVFDKLLWRKVPKELMIDHTMLEECDEDASFIPSDTLTK